MRSTFHKAGNFNLRGKRYLRLGCKCCEIQNLKHREWKKIHAKEIREER